MTNLTDGDACLMSGTTLAAVKDTLAKLALIVIAIQYAKLSAITRIKVSELWLR